MQRWVIRQRIEAGIMAVVFGLSLGWTVWFVQAALRDPLFAPLVERAEAEITVALDRALRGEAAAIEARVRAELAAEPRDWVVIEGLWVLAQEGPVPGDLLALHAAAYETDHGWLATGAACAACAWDLRTCSLSVTLACGVAINLTVVGDVVALTREGGNYLAGSPVDQVDVAISFVGLAATGLVLVSGGSSLTVKAGSALLRVAHRTGRLAPEVLAVFRRGFAQGIDWARLPAVRGADDLALLARPRVLQPALDMASDMGRLQARLGTGFALHVLGRMDTPADVARAARAADGLGPRTVGALEHLGRSRFLRLTLRVADEVVAVLLGAFAALTSLAGLLAPLVARLGRGVGRVGLRLVLRLVIR